MEKARTAAPPVRVARVGPYLLVATTDPTGDEHADLFEIRIGVVHVESFTGNKGLPEAALRKRLAGLLGREPEVRWTTVPG